MVNVDIRSVVHAAVLDSLPEYGCTDYGTYAEQADCVTKEVMERLQAAGVFLKENFDG